MSVETCRACGIALSGGPGYYYRPDTEIRARQCEYGGFVCSEICDRRATLDLEKTMPGHQGQTSLNYQMSQSITYKWKND